MIAETGETARQYVNQNKGSPGENGDVSLVSKAPETVSHDFAFAFDIDGVLLRGGKAIPEAIEALRYLNGDNPYGIKVYVFPAPWFWNGTD